MENAVVVTGASRGIGRELALGFARKGHPLVLAARSEPELRALAAEARVECRVVPVDLSEPAGREALLRACEGIGVAGLVNNAGFGTAGEFAKQDRARERALLRLNVEAPVDLIHLFVPRLPRGGFIVNVASTAAFQAVPLFATYSASKAFVLSLSEALSEELAPRGIHVLALCPGVTESGFQKEADLATPKGAAKASDVAAFALRALARKKRVAIHGAMNKALVFGNRLAPRALVAKLARQVVEPWLQGRA